MVICLCEGEAAIQHNRTPHNLHGPSEEMKLVDRLTAEEQGET